MDIATPTRPGKLEAHFEPFRREIIGIDKTFPTPFGEKPLIYADWTASGRLYRPIERRLAEQIGAFVGNTHTETTITGHAMTEAYHAAKRLIKQHLGAHPRDVLISSNSGMTGVVNKFQRMLGLRVHERFQSQIQLPDPKRPIVFISHMEHHSNQTSWLETLADVEVIRPTPDGLMDLGHLRQLLETYRNRETKIAAITSCSNVTGVGTPYHEVAEIMHRHGGLIFVDFAASAPYIDIKMRPENELRHLDALYFSPHKFLGGPGSSGILVFDPKLYKNRIPDNPGGGTVNWTNPWGGHRYIEEIEAREDGGTPAFLQTMRVALAFQLKAEMGVENILAREHEILQRLWTRFDQLPNLHILASDLRDRLGIISFYIDDLHYNLGVRLLNDRFGIQVRGGCSCAGTYGHYLLHVSQERSRSITDAIDHGDLSAKPGWIRLSVHPTMTDDEVDYLADAVEALSQHHRAWSQDYVYEPAINEFRCVKGENLEERLVADWLNRSLTADRTS